MILKSICCKGEILSVVHIHIDRQRIWNLKFKTKILKQVLCYVRDFSWYISLAILASKAFPHQQNKSWFQWNFIWKAIFYQSNNVPLIPILLTSSDYEKTQEIMWLWLFWISVLQTLIYFPFAFEQCEPTPTVKHIRSRRNWNGCR